jgi:hypothetical protein
MRISGELSNGIRRHIGAGMLATVASLALTASVIAGGVERQTNGVALHSAHSSRAANTIRRSLEYCQRLRSFTLDCELDIHVEKGTYTGGTADTYSVAIQRPNRMAVVPKNSTNTVSVICDGSRVITYIGALNSYQSAPAPASIADIKSGAIHEHAQHLDPLDYLRPLLDGGRADILADGAAIAESAGAENIDGCPCSHVRFAGQGCFWQVWVEDGARPIVHKLECDISVSDLKSVYTDHGMAGAKVEMIAHYRNWKLNPALDRDTFKFTPPTGTQVTASLR